MNNDKLQAFTSILLGMCGYDAPDPEPAKKEEVRVKDDYDEAKIKAAQAKRDRKAEIRRDNDVWARKNNPCKEVK